MNLGDIKNGLKYAKKAFETTTLCLKESSPVAEKHRKLLSKLKSLTEEVKRHDSTFPETFLSDMSTSTVLVSFIDAIRSQIRYEYPNNKNE